MSEVFNLFESEDRLVQESRAWIEAGVLDASAQESMTRLLAGYERLLRETKQLIRLSDRREKELNRLNQELEQLTQSLAFLAEHDSLTGCLNKGAIEKRAAVALSEAETGLLLLDIDHFKRINDSYGHPAGDSVLKHLAERLREACADDDCIGRIGGEEFAILLHRRPSLMRLRAHAERLRRQVETTPILIGAQRVFITVSIGITVGDGGESFSSVYARADRALYAAKEQGRNRVDLAMP